MKRPKRKAEPGTPEDIESTVLQDPLIPDDDHPPIEAEDDSELIEKALRMFARDVETDRHNIEPARQDMMFVLGDQWDPITKAMREQAQKPALTLNRLVAFVSQYIGSALQSDTTIRVIPTSGGTKRIAEIRQGLIRAITRTHPAKQALNAARMTSYICGVGNFGVNLKDAQGDVFRRDIVLEAKTDPFGVIWDRSSKDPTGADAGHCYDIHYMTREDFDARYPEARGDSGWSGDLLDESILTGHGWEIDEMVRVCRFWQMKKEPCTLALEAGTGDVIDVTGWDETAIVSVAASDKQGRPLVRETTRPYAECHVMTTARVLEGPFRLPISRLPLFRVEGWVLEEANVRFRWGFVRFAKDPQRLENYWNSTIAEELMRASTGKWLIDRAAGKNGIIEQFRNAHLTNDNVLEWDSQQQGAKPEFIPPPPINQAVLTEANRNVQAIKDVTNKHEASLGVQGNEVSGRAITARQRVSELGDVIYIENMNAALAEAGRVINELIPVTYDTPRTIKVIGQDDQELLQEINGEDEDTTPDITRGKYDIAYTTGPSYATKRQEAVDMIMTFMNTMPQTATYIADILVRNMDIPGGDEIADRLASMLPPGVVDIERMPESKKQQILAQQQAQAQQAQQQQAMQQAQFTLEMAKLEAETAELKARAAKSMAEAQRTMSEVGVKAEANQIDAAQVQVNAAKVAGEGEQRRVDAFEMGLNEAARGADREDARDEREAKAKETKNAAQDK